MSRDGVEVPRVLEKCAEAIELHGLDSKGIYRLSGTTSRVQRLKAALDHGQFCPGASPSACEVTDEIHLCRHGIG